MTEENRAEISSPLATAEEIYRRLVRPSGHCSLEDVRTRNSWRQKVISLTEFAEEEVKTKEKENKKKKKLEDYLDPGLLAEISSKISRAKKAPPATKKPVKEMVKGFDWPAEDSIDVDLKDNSDPIYGAEEQEEEACTPFRRFEQIALRHFSDF